MEYRLCLLILASFFAQNFAELDEKPPVIDVTEENQEEFGLPVGTRLELDERTKLYKPPPLANNFTAKDRIKIMWKSPITHKNFCKVGPSLHRNVFNRAGQSYFYYSWCLDKRTSEDLCCDYKYCTCSGPWGSDCACLSDEARAYYDRKKMHDEKLAKGIFAFGVKVVKEFVKNKDDKGGDKEE